jgi:hypothetical protein
MNSLTRQIELQKAKEANDRSRNTADISNSYVPTRSSKAFKEEVVIGGDNTQFLTAASTMPSSWAYNLPIATASILGGVKINGGNLTIDPATGILTAVSGSDIHWDGSSTGLNASLGRTSLGLGTAATHNVGDFITSASPVFTTSFGFSASSWRIVENGTSLELRFNGGLKGILTNSGAMSFLGEVIAYASI